jgi:hypothetical protein
MEDFMTRKRKSDQTSTEANTPAGTALAELDHTVPIENHEEATNFADRVGRPNDRVASPDPFKIAGDYLAGVHLFESRQDRQVAISFDDKPSQLILDKLKEAGYRWNASDRVWAHPVRQGSALGTRIDAERLYQEVRDLVRQEKGLEAGQEVPF